MQANKYAIPDGIIMHVNQLKNNSLRDRAISKYVTDIAKSVMEELRTANRIGYSVVSVHIPTVFSVPNTTNAEAQRIIWSSVIEGFERKGFGVSIDIKPDSCELTVALQDQDDVDLIATQHRIIASHASKRQ